jgi:hypothetical protein
MMRKTLLALGLLLGTVAVSATATAAESGVMICQASTHQNGVWQADNCSTVRPSPPCDEIDICTGCGCWDVLNVDPNSVPPNAVGKVKKRKARQKDR